MRDCPFPQLRGILLDTVKSQSQKQCLSIDVTADSSASAAVQLNAFSLEIEIWPPRKKATNSQPLSGKPCVEGGLDSELAPLLWRGPSYSIFFSLLALRTFCLPAITKMRGASTHHMLDHVDEIGAALNLLIHFVIKLNSIMEAISQNPHRQTNQLSFFLGLDIASFADSDGYSDATAATRHLLHSEVKPLIVEVLDIVRRKVLKLEGKLMDSVAHYHYRPHIPWSERATITREVEIDNTGKLDSHQPLCQLDSLQLDVLLDNLEFLLRVLK